MKMEILKNVNVYDFKVEELLNQNIDMNILDEISNISCVYIQYTSDLKKFYVGESNRYFESNSFSKGRFWEHIHESAEATGNINYNGFENIMMFTSKDLKGNADILETLLLKNLDVEFLSIKNRRLTNSRIEQKHTEDLSIEIENEVFPEIWNYLIERKFVKSELSDVAKNQLKYYSPYGKSIDDIEMQSAKKIIRLGEADSSYRNLIINGEPGTGKTFITTIAVMELINKRKKVAIIVNQTTIKKLYISFFKTFKDSEKPFIGSLANFHNKVNSGKIDIDEFSLIVVDEAHRLRQSEGKQQMLPSVYVLEKSKPDFTELDILLNYQKPLVLMYDKFQLIRDSDITINKFILKTSGFDSITLENQYRIKSTSNISPSNYTKGLRNILQLEESKYDVNIFKDGYDFKIVDSVKDLVVMINGRLNLGDKYKNSRLLSGYYKKWISKEKGQFEWTEDLYSVNLKWNTPNDKLGKKNWLEFTREKQAELQEVGCVHVVQGLDLDYAGVIIGKDIKISNIDGKDLVVADENNYFDSSGKPIKDTDIENIRLNEYLKRIYYILLTRGVYGTYVYFEDKDVERYFKKMMKLSTVS
ncbi:hypothetical protein IGI37_003085 [Enterococcus sp. AZ194]|uniref:DNA/RNA helicase domain-containing protein n=1 Tax=Enterococcus sp. AZ194 TaxID=2774629 RepID=UPI003F271C31